MTKARDLGSLLGASSQIDNTKITLDANEIPNLDAGKITSGSLGVDRVPNLDAGKITTGTFADARISQSSVSQHATSFDDNKIVNDISTLALTQASNDNRSAYNTNSSFVDVFQDATGIDTITNAFRNTNEYINTIEASTGGVNASTIMLVDGNSTLAPFTDLINGMTGSTNDIGSTGGTPTYNTGNQKWSGYNVLDLNDGTISYGTQYTSYWNGTGDYTVEFWFKGKGTLNTRERFWCFGTSNEGQMSYGCDYGNPSDFNVYSNTTNYDPSGTFTHPSNDTSWRHIRFVRSGSTTYYFFDGSLISTLSGGNPTNTMNENFRISGRTTGASGGTEFFNAYYTDFMIHTTALSTSSYSVPTEKAIAGAGTNATGNFTGTTITAPSSVSEMGAIITYQDQEGTNALNTDIVLELSADNGSNWSTATLSALPNFSTGIKMAKVNDLAVTAGTQLKYRLNFANQASGSKEARIRGVALQY